MAGDDALRLFLALQLPGTVLDALAGWGGRELFSGRRVARENLHVTLAFLGRRPVAEVPAVVDALGHAARGVAAFELAPSRWRETSSVGMLVLADPSGTAGRLAATLHEALEQLGVYRHEERPWLPHVTMLRFRGPRPRLQPGLPPVERFVPSGAAAYLSRLHPSGARYEVLKSFRLGG